MSDEITTRAGGKKENNNKKKKKKKEKNITQLKFLKAIQIKSNH